MMNESELKIWFPVHSIKKMERSASLILVILVNFDRINHSLSILYRYVMIEI